MNQSTHKRRYRSALRDAAAAENRSRVVAAAIKLFREADSASISMESVAKAAGVTRLTIYNQFGSRAALLESVFDELARAGGLSRIPEAMAISDPRSALAHLVEIFCDFWASNPAVVRVNLAASTDTEFAAALAARNERRRRALSILVKRLAQAGQVGPGNSAAVIDALFALSSPEFFRALSTGRRSKLATRTLVLRLCEATLESFQ